MSSGNLKKTDDSYRQALLHVRDLLRRRPHSILEIFDCREIFDGDDLSIKQNLPEILHELVQAGEIIHIGHTVYQRVPWTPAGEVVISDPEKEFIYALLTRVSTKQELLKLSNLSEVKIHKILIDLIKEGLVTEHNDKFRIVSKTQMKHLKEGSLYRL